MRGGYGGAGAEGYQIARCWRQLTPSGTPLRRRASSPRGGAQVTAEPQLCDRYKLTESHSPSIRAPSARHHTSSLFHITSYFEKEPPGCRSVIFRCRAPQNNASHASHGRAVTCMAAATTLLHYSLFLLPSRGRSRASPPEEEPRNERSWGALPQNKARRARQLTPSDLPPLARRQASSLAEGATVAIAPLRIDLAADALRARKKKARIPSCTRAASQPPG